MAHPLPASDLGSLMTASHLVMARSHAETARITASLPTPGRRGDLRIETLSAIMREVFHVSLACQYAQEYLVNPAWWAGHKPLQLMKTDDSTTTAVTYLTAALHASVLNTAMHLDAYLRALHSALDRPAEGTAPTGLVAVGTPVYHQRLPAAFPRPLEFLAFLEVLRATIRNHGIYHDHQHPNLTLPLHDKSYVFKSNITPTSLQPGALLERIDDAFRLVAATSTLPAVAALPSLEDPHGTIRVNETETFYPRTGGRSRSG